MNNLWAKYDEDDLGELDKIETANFVNEVFVSKGLGLPSMERFNMFFQNFENGQSGMICRADMADFIKSFYKYC